MKEKWRLDEKAIGTAQYRIPGGEWMMDTFSWPLQTPVDRIYPRAIALKMPTICRFYGILIQMYFDDHPPPHFHVIYNEYKAVIGIHDFSILEGDLPPKALGLVMEWARRYKHELLAEWDLAKNKQSLFPIQPLE